MAKNLSEDLNARTRQAASLQKIRPATGAKTALVLAGHGSHISPATAGVVWSHVDALRAMHIADEVTAAFWKEMPSFSSVLDTLSADDITIVPLFTAQGYFTQTVIPAEMGLTGRVTIRDGRTIRYARTLSEHPYLTQVVRQRVETALADLNISAEKAAVAIIGHSTRRNPESRKATEAQAAALRPMGLAGQVEAVYLDDWPEIADIYRMTTAPVLIAVPFFLAMGSHTTIDVPHELGLPPGKICAEINGRLVYYTPPVGTETALREVLLELARAAGAPLHVPVTGSTWDCFPAVGGAELIADVQTNHVVRFGELCVTPHKIGHLDDRLPQKILTSPAELRTFVRENPFRPLATAAGLPGGWQVNITDAKMIPAVIETIYPGAIADRSALHSSTLTVNSLDRLAARQTGMYRRVNQLAPEKQAALVNQVCGHCVRYPLWFASTRPADKLPCREACNFWLSAALEDE